MRKVFVLAVAALLVFSSCDKNESQDPTITIPASYMDNNYATNAEAEIVVRTQMAAIATKAKWVRTAGVSVRRQELIDLYLQDCVTNDRELTF